jgi:phosphatidylglycerophosphate synthase
MWFLLFLMAAGAGGVAVLASASGDWKAFLTFSVLAGLLVFGAILQLGWRFMGRRA